MLSKQIYYQNINAVEFLTTKSVDGLTVLMEHLLSLKGLDKNEDIKITRKENKRKVSELPLSELFDNAENLSLNFQEPEPNTYERYYGDAVDNNGKLTIQNNEDINVVNSPSFDDSEKQKKLLEFANPIYCEGYDNFLSRQKDMIDSENKLREKYPNLDNGFKTPYRGGPPPKSKEKVEITDDLIKDIENLAKISGLSFGELLNSVENPEVKEPLFRRVETKKK